MRESISQQFENNFLVLQLPHKSQIELHSRGNSAQFFPSPRESRDISFQTRGIPAIPIPVQVSTTDG